jgi:hypothetical protein
MEYLGTDLSTIIFVHSFFVICIVEPYFSTDIVVDRVGFEPTTSAMPMPYPTGLDDRPMQQMNSFIWLLIVLMKKQHYNHPDFFEVR